MPKSTTSIAGRAHSAKISPPAPQTKQYRPQLTGLEGVHPEVARSVQTAFDFIYEQRNEVQALSAKINAMSGAAGSTGAAGSNGSGSGAGSNASKVSDNILGLKIKGATDPSALQHGSMTTWNSSTGQFEFATPAGFVSPPASSSAPGVAGQIAHDGTSAYFCVGTNSWMKAPLSSF
jgi:hypothetical protein